MEDIKKVKGTQTEVNLLKTFAGESRARNKYNLYGEKAKEEGNMWVANVFNETAANEYAHAREVYNKYLGMVGDSVQNLKDSVMGEADEAEKIYKEYEETARKEGFKDIADFFKELREVEESHKERFLNIHDKLKAGTLYKGKDDTMWKCSNCGYIHIGKEAPEVCPLCKYKRGYFEEYCNCKNMK